MTRSARLRVRHIWSRRPSHWPPLSRVPLGADGLAGSRPRGEAGDRRPAPATPEQLTTTPRICANFSPGGSTARSRSSSPWATPGG